MGSRAYWDNIHKQAAANQLSGLQAVCNPGLSKISNRVLDRIHLRALKRLLNAAEGLTSTKALDLGCGRGRWCRFYRNRGWQTFGMDLSPHAFTNEIDKRGIGFSAGNITFLPFREKSLDWVSHVTVVQHIPKDLHEPAFDEIKRILKPGGFWLLMEHFSRDDNTVWEGVFPRTIKDWRNQMEKRGFEVVLIEKFQFLPILKRVTHFFTWIEKIRRSIRFPSEKIRNPETSLSGGKNEKVDTFATTTGSRKISLRRAIYLYSKKFLIDSAMIGDTLPNLFMGNRRGSHVGILGRRIV